MEKTYKKEELIKSIFEQHCLHARHVENERLWLTNIFAIIFAGSLAVIKEKLFDIYGLPLNIFLMIFSLFCIIFSLKIDSIFKTHTNQADKILKSYKLPLMSSGFVDHWVNKKIRISRLFPIFFSTCFNFLLFVTLLVILKNYIYSLIIPIMLFIISCIIFYRLKYDKFERSESPSPKRA